MNAPLRNITTVADLAAAGLVTDADQAALGEIARRYAIAITPQMSSLIEAGDPADPIARQFAPAAAELNTLPHETDDPIADGPHSPVRGIVHRYPDRALLKLTTVCPVYCRFCFRREMVGPAHGGTLDRAALAEAIGYVRATPAIAEVIVTGGDPLILSPRRIAEVSCLLASIPHVRAIRWHSRVPIVAPERVTADLVAALSAPGRVVRIAIHANHPREFTAPARDALARLGTAGIELISQSVLLAGVNDDAAALADLVSAFIAAGVAPYYIHHLDPAPGTAHFRVPISRGMAMMASLSARLPGVPLPRYTLDLPGGHGKVPIAPPHVVARGGGIYHVIDRFGRAHRYADGH
ncbi:MAG: lysine-2,3-aminomutase-like protein [Hyphomicrobiaceae bacterium]